VLNPGIRGKVSIMVSAARLADRMGNPGMPVFSTPAMVQAMEKAATFSVKPFLEPGQGTVGVSLQIRHLAATPVGMGVRCETELIEVDGRRLVFRVDAFDELEKIGEGIHERFIVDLPRFLDRVEGKAARRVANRRS
jgi:fluoroacetyl-CoA thioesterase